LTTTRRHNKNDDKADVRHHPKGCSYLVLSTMTSKESPAELAEAILRRPLDGWKQDFLLKQAPWRQQRGSVVKNLASKQNESQADAIKQCHKTDIYSRDWDDRMQDIVAMDSSLCDDKRRAHAKSRGRDTAHISCLAVHSLSSAFVR